MAARIMRNKVAACFVIVLILLASTTVVRAVTYGTGTYNSNLYSAAVPDTTAPVISSISAGTPSQTTATITWTTDEAADSQVQYGTTVSYGTATTLDATLTTSHSVALSGLTASTLYYYRVLSRDASTNLATSAGQTFMTSAVPDTTAPVLSAGSPTGLLTTTTSATLTLSTNEAATCRYSTTASTIYTSMTGAFDSTGGATHSTSVSGLQPSTPYIYYVRCVDSAANATTSDYTISFTTATTRTSTTSGGYPSSVRNMPITPTVIPTPTVVSHPVLFTQLLSVGKRHAQVLLLQHYLNTHGFAVALKGPGSLGSETTLFGRATKAALIKFQIAHKILPATGAFGPKTMLFINTDLSLQKK